jgi:hypothetical protein
MVQSTANGLEKIAGGTTADEVGEHPGVGLGQEDMVFSLYPGAQGAVVLDDPVVEECDVPPCDRYAGGH